MANGGHPNWLSRSFWVVLLFGVLGFVLSWQLEDATAFTVVASTGLGGWFAGKGVSAFQNRKANGGS